MAVTTYYIDGHSGISDPNGVWSNDANAFNGSLADIATCSTAGNAGSNEYNLYLSF